MSAEHFPEKNYYQGRVKDQQMSWRGKEGEAQYPELTLVVALEGQLVDTYDPTKGTVTCPAVDVDVKFSFNPDNGQKLLFNAKDLASLGFDDDDIEKLNPAAKGHTSFVGKTVFVTPKHSVYNDKERTFWNLRFPRKYQPRPVAKGQASKSPAAAAYREAIIRLKEEQAATSSSSAPF